MTLIFRRNFDDELDREAGGGANTCTCAHPTQGQIDVLIEDAKSIGFQSGLEAGHNKALKELRKEAAQNQNDTLVDIKKQLQDLFEKSDSHSAALESQVLDFSLSICEQLFPYLLHSQSHERAYTQIKETMRLAIGSPTIHIALSKTAFPILTPFIEQAAKELGVLTHIKLSIDENLNDGATHIEWKNGFMEYNFETVCERILCALKAAQKTNLSPLVNESETNA